MFNKVNKYVGMFVLICGALGIIWGGFQGVVSVKAYADTVVMEVAGLKQDVQLLKLQKLYDEAQEDYYRAKRFFKMNPDDEEAEEEFYEAKEYRDKLRDRIRNLKIGLVNV